jgi:hypothetical protein
MPNLEDLEPAKQEDKLEQELGNETRVTFMVNVTNIINWFKNRRKKKDEKSNVVTRDVTDRAVDDLNKS